MVRLDEERSKRGGDLPVVTKPRSCGADTEDMSEGGIEPRTAMWARAEVSWEDAGGAAKTAPATLEDTSLSGACIRVKAPIGVGSRLTVKWHREQFSAIARNCRRDGREFLLGVRRDHANHAGSAAEKTREDSTGSAVKVEPNRETKREVVQGSLSGAQGGPSSHERNDMESKSVFPKFWRREPSGNEAPINAVTPEVSVQPMQARPSGAVTGMKNELLSYEDIYRAAGILRPRSGYDMTKVVEMLHSERIRDLSDEARRASVLMAIEAAGSSVDDLMRDANERQQALENYEAGQKRQLEEFEARKAKENAEIEGEMARVTARCAERIKANQEQLAAEKEALTHWQMLKQNESQRIAEVMALRTKPAAEPVKEAMAASAGGRSSSGPSLVS